MPTKLNHAGNQQNYVPAGNGDASGEYGDNATGSNRHFTNFAKPKDGGDKGANGGITSIDKPKEQSGIEIKQQSGIEIRESKDFSNYVNERFKEDKEFSKILTDGYNLGDEDSKHLVNKSIKENKLGINKTSNQISHYSGQENEISYNTRDMNDKEKKGTFYHEFWHGFDNIYAKEFMPDNFSYKAFVENKNAKDILLGRYMSTGYKLSNGKTLFETIKEECRKMKKDGRWDNIKNDYNNEINRLVSEKFGGVNIPSELRKLNIQFGEEADKEMKEKYPNIDKYSREYYKIREDIIDDKRNKHPNYKEWQDNELKYTYEKSKISSEVADKYINLSDMYGISQKISYGFCGGHAGNYGNKNPGSIAKEFLAELGSATSTNDKNLSSMFEKYMPESIKYGKELINIIIKKSKGE